eukprot:TRINITY_DN19565_c0_g1_i1.p1 TRINITY_DN19565_c0_g1~~TRINITY_DN19565_c0_g1_i1.p1  ORF type:complete len:462 (+),score=64.57 TRINITY_DN19565_c0_g1_i1:53-1387(+)
MDPLGGLNGFLQEIVSEVKQVHSDLNSLKDQFLMLNTEVRSEYGLKNRVCVIEASLHSVQQQLKREKTKRQQVTVTILLQKSKRSFLGEYFSLLTLHSQGLKTKRRRQEAVRQISKTTSIQTLSWFFTNWRRFRKRAMSRATGYRTAKNLLLKNLKTHVQKRLRAWQTHTERKTSRKDYKKGVVMTMAKDFENSINHKLLKRYFDAMGKRVRTRSALHAIHREACLATLREKWAKFIDFIAIQRWAALRREISTSNENRLHHASRRASYRKLLKFVEKEKLKRTACERTTFIQICAIKSTLRRCLAKLKRNAELKHRAAMDRKVELSLSTLTNTNTILNELVERFLNVDQQISALERNKIGRKELQGLGAERESSLQKTEADAERCYSLPSARSGTADYTCRTAASHSPIPVARQRDHTPSAPPVVHDQDALWAAHFADIQSRE